MIERDDLVENEECTVNSKTWVHLSPQKALILIDEGPTAGNVMKSEMRIYIFWQSARQCKHPTNISPEFITFVHSLDT